MHKANIILPFSITAENVEVNTAVVWVSTSHVEIDATTIISGSNCKSAEFTFCRIPCKLKSSIMPCMLRNRCRPPIQTRRSASISEISQLNASTLTSAHAHQNSSSKTGIMDTNSVAVNLGFREVWKGSSEAKFPTCLRTSLTSLQWSPPPSVIGRGTYYRPLIYDLTTL